GLPGTPGRRRPAAVAGRAAAPDGAADFTACEELLTGAGSRRARALAPHGAVPHLLSGSPRTLAAAGLDGLDGFAGALLDSVCPEEGP
ncbi:hypothetical protein AB0F18_36070, partial [Streptomyces sp. NPDC029216]